MKHMNPVTSLKRFREAYRLTKQWERQLDEASALMAQFGMKYDFTRELFCSTMPGKILVALGDQALAVGASATVNGTGANKSTCTDAVALLSNTGGSGTVTPTVQGSNVLASGYVAVNPDKANVALSAGALPALVGATSLVVAHYAQLQFQFYRVSYTSAATSGTTATDIFLFMPVEDSFSATVQ